MITPGHSYSLGGRAPSGLAAVEAVGAADCDGEEDRGRPKSAVLSAEGVPGSSEAAAVRW